MPDNAPTLISIAVPVLNEAENVEHAYTRVRSVFDSLAPRYEFEIVFTDNHSDDDTFERIQAIAERDPRVRAFRFSRNFGFQRSILAGYRRARGAAAVQLDCDLQDPPELIPRFIELWEQGHHVVYGVRETRKEAARLTFARKSFYRLANMLAEDPLPLDAGDFRLIDRRVLDVLCASNDAQPYLRGAIAAMGFKQIGVPYERERREHGESKFSFGSMLALSLDGILNHSIVPLRLATYTGLVVSLLTFLGTIVFSVGRFVLGQSWPAGFATTTILITLSLSLNALFLGIIGEYLGRIYKQVKHGPNVIVERAIDPYADAGPGVSPCEEAGDAHTTPAARASSV